MSNNSSHEDGYEYPVANCAYAYAVPYAPRSEYQDPMNAKFGPVAPDDSDFAQGDSVQGQDALDNLPISQTSTTLSEDQFEPLDRDDLDVYRRLSSFLNSSSSQSTQQNTPASSSQNGACSAAVDASNIEPRIIADTPQAIISSTSTGTKRRRDSAVEVDTQEPSSKRARIEQHIDSSSGQSTRQTTPVSSSQTETPCATVDSSEIDPRMITDSPQHPTSSIPTGTKRRRESEDQVDIQGPSSKKARSDLHLVEARIVTDTPQPTMSPPLPSLKRRRDSAVDTDAQGPSSKRARSEQPIISQNPVNDLIFDTVEDAEVFRQYQDQLRQEHGILGAFDHTLNRSVSINGFLVHLHALGGGMQAAIGQDGGVASVGGTSSAQDAAQAQATAQAQAVAPVQVAAQIQAATQTQGIAQAQVVAPVQVAAQPQAATQAQGAFPALGVAAILAAVQAQAAAQAPVTYQAQGAAQVQSTQATPQISASTAPAAAAGTTSNVGLRSQSIGGYPAQVDPIPGQVSPVDGMPHGLSLYQICQTYPNHLQRKFLIPFIEANWSAKEIFECLPQSVQTFWISRQGADIKYSDNMVMTPRLSKTEKGLLGTGKLYDLLRPLELNPNAQHMRKDGRPPHIERHKSAEQTKIPYIEQGFWRLKTKNSGIREMEVTALGREKTVELRALAVQVAHTPRDTDADLLVWAQTEMNRQL